MCRRFRSIHEWSEIPRYLYSGPLINFAYNPNVAPTDLVPVFLAQLGGQPKTIIARFGINLVGKDGKPKPLHNARLDGMRRGQFRSHLKNQRCVIPAAGFYDWREEDGLKQPYYFFRKNGVPLMLAGIWQESEYKEDCRAAFAILTEDPTPFFAAYHDRMPVALADDRVSAWLDLSQNPALDDGLFLDMEAFGVRLMNLAVNSSSQKDLVAIEAAP